MKTVIFSPMATGSAIGRVTALLVSELARRDHTVIVVRTERPAILGSHAHPCDAKLIAWTDGEAVADAIREADQLVYQIGDNHPFHCGGVHWLQRAPGVVCLHDFFVANLFVDWAEAHRSEAERVLAKWYGETAAIDFFNASNSQEFFDKASKSYPMTEWICAMAHGVVSHSNWGMERVARSCAGPVRVLPLAYDAPGAVPALARPKPADAIINVLTVGHANPNKRIESVIRAIGSSDRLRELVSYRLCGAIDAHIALSFSALARSLGVEFVISGKTDEIALQRAMRAADVICSLRWPSLEAASASAIEGLMYGKAVIVTDTGFYGEMPDDCVRKVSPHNEAAELQASLELLCTDVEARQAMASRGQEWAMRTFTAANYVEHLLDLSRAASTAAPAIRMAGSLVAQLEHWGSSRALMEACDLEAALALFKAPDDPAPSVA